MIRKIIALSFFILTLSLQSAAACTGIQLQGADGTVVRSRTLEWGPFEVHPRVDVVPRGYDFKTALPDGKPGLEWKARFGFVGISAMGVPAYVDGINETGLSAGMFYLPGFTEYLKYDPKEASKSIGSTNVIGYILSTCSSLDEVRKAFSGIRVVDIEEPAVGFVMPLHYYVAEPSGKALVVEFNNREMQIFDAPLGVVTNSPTYDWHLTNLRNYINLSAVSVPTKDLTGNAYAPLGAGSGMIGLPGDFTPPSRFIRAVAFSQSARKTKGGYDTVRESFRIMDSFNVPAEAAEGADDNVEAKGVIYSATQITTAADMKNLKLYYHTQFDRRVRMIDLKKIDFAKMGDKMLTKPADTNREEDILEIKP